MDVANVEDNESNQLGNMAPIFSSNIYLNVVVYRFPPLSLSVLVTTILLYVYIFGLYIIIFIFSYLFCDLTYFPLNCFFSSASLTGHLCCHLVHDLVFYYWVSNSEHLDFFYCTHQLVGDSFVTWQVCLTYQFDMRLVGDVRILTSWTFKEWYFVVLSIEFL